MFSIGYMCPVVLELLPQRVRLLVLIRKERVIVSQTPLHERWHLHTHAHMMYVIVRV